MKHAALYEFAPASELGPAEDYPVGSVEWAERISNRLQLGTMSIGKHTIHHFWKTIKEIWTAKPPPWEVWPIPPFGTPDDYCKAVTGHSWEFLVGVVAEFADDPELTIEKMRAELARAQAEHRPQGKHHRHDVPLRGGNSSEKLLRRLARDHEDILARYEAGEFPSVRAAAKAAGIVTVLTPLQQIERLLPKLSDTDRLKLKEILNRTIMG